MIKKTLFTLFFVLITTSVTLAATQLKVVSVNDFSTEKPSDHIVVKVLEEKQLGDYHLDVNSVLYCQVTAVVEPKRGKRNATFFVRPISYTDHSKTIKIEEEMYGKYSKFALNKEELKKIPSFDNMKKVALSVGNHFVKGLSVAYSFVEGIVKNEDDNRLKSGVTNAYEESPLSYISEGQHLEIKVGDDFYLVFKRARDKDESEEDLEIVQEEMQETEKNGAE